MKVTREELQEYFDAPLPGIGELADAFTFHAFEIDSVEGDTLDIKILPNRTADCATPLGVARELSAILDLPTKGGAAPEYAGQSAVRVTVALINAILGADFSRDEMLEVFRRSAFRVEEEGEMIRVTAPVPRTDIVIPEDVAEEVGQILGYDRVPPLELKSFMWDVLRPTLDVGRSTSHMPDQARFRGIERVKDFLVERGFTEISTQSFAESGDIELANPMDKTHPFLRTGLEENMAGALARAKQCAPLVLPPNQEPKLFEIGSVFTKDGERLAVLASEPVPDLPAIEDAPDYEPKRSKLGAYRPFSLYPFIARDISMWITDSPEARGAVFKILFEHGAGLLRQVQLVDQFTNKEGRQSLAFRLIFQSFERTLTDDEVNAIMEDISATLGSAGHEVR